MAVWVGTSGYNYPEWKGSFYPHKLPASQMLAYYAQRLSSVEINYTFYRSPAQKTLEAWSLATPEQFKLTLKAPKRITHDARLRDCEPAVQHFCGLASILESKLGVLLFQLPPSFKKDLVVLDAFLEALPAGTRAAMEFRHGSWLDDETLARLAARNVALCVADSESFWTPVEVTADYGYFRLRDEGYGQQDIEHWARTIHEKTAACTDVFVYFKHEEAGKGPQFAHALMAAMAVL